MIMDNETPLKIKLPNGTVTKLVYTHSVYIRDESGLRTLNKEVYTIRRDGCVNVKYYKLKSRRLRLECKDTDHISREAFSKLVSRLVKCAENADSDIVFYDNSAATLRVYYKWGRVKKLDRGVGYKNKRIRDIMDDFVDEL